MLSSIVLVLKLVKNKLKDVSNFNFLLSYFIVLFDKSWTKEFFLLIFLKRMILLHYSNPLNLIFFFKFNSNEFTELFVTLFA